MQSALSWKLVDFWRLTYLARVLGEAAVGSSKTNTFLAARYRRIARRRGQPRAVVAVGRSILVIIWRLLNDPDAHYQDLGVDHYQRHVDSAAKKRGHIRRLEALGYSVTPHSRGLKPRGAHRGQPTIIFGSASG